MGKGVCTRRQRKILQSFLLITVICGSMYAFMISYEMHKQLKKTEAMALKYQQHQESLSAQLQVVYEHRSRLEKSLQRERMEHKRARDDHLAYKLESEQSLNKEKESINRFNALQAQHQILKSQHEDLKKQYYELQEQHQNQGETHERMLDEHREEIDHLQRAKEMEISRLKENVYNLKEENRQLRKAHQDIRTQLLDVRLHVAELQQPKGQEISSRPTVVPRRVDTQFANHQLSEVPESKPSPHTDLPGHSTTHPQTSSQLISDKEKVVPEVPPRLIPDVLDVGNDRNRAPGIKPIHEVALQDQTKAAERPSQTTFQHWRSRLDHNILDGGPAAGNKLHRSHEEGLGRKEGVGRLKRQPEILDPDNLLGDSHLHQKVQDEDMDIQVPAKELQDRVLDLAETEGEDEMEEVGEPRQLQRQQVKRVGGDPVPLEQAGRLLTGSQERVAQEEQLVMAGSPNQHEDNMDDQYEEVEEEDDQQKREEPAGGNDEDLYSEENAEQGLWNGNADDGGERKEEGDYQEDVEIVEENQGPRARHINRRAEM